MVVPSREKWGKKRKLEKSVKSRNIFVLRKKRQKLKSKHEKQRNTKLKKGGNARTYLISPPFSQFSLLRVIKIQTRKLNY